MEGTYDDDFHRDQGFETFDDWFDDWETKYFQYLHEQEVRLEKKSFRIYLRKFSLKNCSNTQCNGNYILKYNENKNILFWGCSEFPKCRYTCSILPNIRTITKCNKCDSYYKIERIYKNNEISLICENKNCNDVIIISSDVYLSDID